MKDVDLMVIGSGPAGQRAAIQGAKCGASVVVVERRQWVGGVCTHTGTIPSKTLREAILYLTGFRYRAIYGRGHFLKRRLTFDELMHRVNHVIKHETEVARDRLMRNGVEVVNGIASFESPNEIVVAAEDETRKFRAGKI